MQLVDGRVGHEQSTRHERRGADERVARHVRAGGLHVAEDKSPVGQNLRQERESAGSHTEQARHEKMAEFVQKHAGEKEHGEQANRQPGVAGGDEKDSLDFAVQKPLEKYQRREGEEE